MTEQIFKGHAVSKGKAIGEALVSQTPISFRQGVNAKTGLVIEKGHELEGQSITDKILVFPKGKGSTLGSYSLYEMSYLHIAPKAIINRITDSIVTIGAIIGDIPVVDRLEQDPCAVITTGDLVEVDVSQGIVKVKSAHPSR